MHRSVVVGIVVFVLVGIGCTAPAFASSGPAGDPVPAELERVQSTEEFDTTTYDITVRADGSATWTFRHERHLESESDREEFLSFAEEFESTELPLYERFVGQAEALVETGAERTDREMTAESFNRSAGIEEQVNSIGVVEMSFTWTNFASVEPDTDVVSVGGDVFEGDLYIADSQTLTVVPEDGLSFRRVDPPGDFAGQSLQSASSVSWRGEREFGDGRPIAVLEPENGGTSQPQDGRTLSVIDSQWRVAGGLFAVFALGVAAAIAWYRFGPPDGLPSRSDGEPDPPATGSESTESGGDPVATTDGSAAGPAPIPDEELLSDEDRVVELIRQNGGRMKQVRIVEETGWSKSKVSMLLSEMETEGTISKLRVGRENIISLEGFEPEATKSPFDE